MEKTMTNIYRDQNLQQISEDDIGKEIRVAGWIENIRDHGGVSFVDLRDMYGVLQVVMRTGTKRRIIRAFLPGRLNWKHARLMCSEESTSSFLLRL